MIKCKLGDILDVKRGASLSGKYYSTKGKMVRLTLGNFNYPNGGFKENTAKEDIFFLGDVKTEFILKKGDIITPLTEQVAGLLGETARIPESNKYIQSGDIGLVIPNEKKLDKSFAYYLISSPQIKKQLGAAAQQTKIRHTSPGKIKSCETWIPDLKYQEKAGYILDVINSKIINNKKINMELEQMAKTIYDYWFLQYEFPNENNKPYKSSGGRMVWNDELKKEIPEGWKVGNIGDLIDTQSGYAFKSSEWKKSGHPVLTIKTINEDGSINIEDASYINCNYNKNLNKYSAQNGNMIFAMSGNTIGKVGIIASKAKDVLINQRVLIIKTRTDDIAFSYFIMKDKKIQNHIFQLGANSAQPNISEENLRNIKIYMPNKNILDKYNKKCKNLFNKIIANRVENEELMRLMNFLLPLLMNGQVEFKS